MKRCVIFGAAPVADAAPLRALLRADDMYLAADGGVHLAAALGIQPSLTVADCDSAQAPIDGALLLLPREKDDTDTRMAMNTAFAWGYRDFLLLGCLGGRLDHTVANLLSARQMTEKGCHVVLADEKNEATVLLPGVYHPAAGEARAVSFFAMTPYVKGLTLEGFQYPLQKYLLTSDNPLCVSNAVTAQGAAVSFTEGTLLQIFSND